MERIVLISRDVTFRGLIGAELIERGFDVEGVDTVEEALDMLGDRGSTPRLVILEARVRPLTSYRHRICRSWSICPKSSSVPGRMT